MINDVKKEAEQRMQRGIEAFKDDLRKLRTGRAHAGLLEHVMVEYYGTNVPVKQTANISVEDARTLLVTPWEKKMVSAVEKAIINSGLGLNPVTAGQVIRVPLPPMTEERRRDLVKVVRGLAEEGKVALRNIRRDTMHDLRELRDSGEAGADDEHRAEEALQKLTDEKVRELDALVKAKEEEILEV
jgi:ribosome recycling factor